MLASGRTHLLEPGTCALLAGSTGAQLVSIATLRIPVFFLALFAMPVLRPGRSHTLAPSLCGVLLAAVPATMVTVEVQVEFPVTYRTDQ
jgi:hypothetical protein